MKEAIPLPAIVPIYVHPICEPFMPTYDYQCDACDSTWELFQKITDDPIKKCPHCGKRKARRLFGTGAALMFKGSGFYETDYRSESYKNSAKADQKSGDGGSDASSGGTDTGKSDGPTETKAAATPKAAAEKSQPTSPSGKKSSEAKSRKNKN